MNSTMQDTEQALRDKEEVVKQWNNDPCGISGASGLPVGTREFYERIDRNRYVEYAPWLLRVMDPERFRGKRLLEVGFGMGTDLFQFASHGAIVSGIDLTPKHLEIASRRFELYGIPADLTLGDAENLPYDDNSFDAVYTFGVIHHTPNTTQAINEIYRVLEAGGQAIIAVYHRWSAFYLISQLLFHRILSGRFLREPLRRTLSRMEYREHSDACPLVKVYNRRELRAMLQSFSTVHIQVHHLELSHFSRLHRIIPASVVRKLEEHMGWYLIATCTK